MQYQYRDYLNNTGHRVGWYKDKNLHLYSGCSDSNMNMDTWNSEVYHGLTQFIQSISRERLQFPSKVSN
jgi:hypothetical protein